jgi:hypothetical protein
VGVGGALPGHVKPACGAVKDAEAGEVRRCSWVAVTAAGADFLAFMNTATPCRGRRQAGAAPVAAALVALLAVIVALLAGRPGGDAAESVSGPISPTSSANTSSAPARLVPVPSDRAGAAARIELVVGDEIATATLADTPEARAVAAILPVSVEMDDGFGQAKTGRLPGELGIDDAARARSYAAGDLSYWSPSSKIAVVYDALGESVPAPGLVRLGTVDTGLSAIASAGNDFTMTIRAAH